MIDKHGLLIFLGCHPRPRVVTEITHDGQMSTFDNTSDALGNLHCIPHFQRAILKTILRYLQQLIFKI